MSSQRMAAGYLLSSILNKFRAVPKCLILSVQIMHIYSLTLPQPSISQTMAD